MLHQSVHRPRAEIAIAEGSTVGAMTAGAKAASDGVEDAGGAGMVDALAEGAATALIGSAASCPNRSTLHRALTKIIRGEPPAERAPFRPFFPASLLRSTKSGLPPLLLQLRP